MGGNFHHWPQHPGAVCPWADSQGPLICTFRLEISRCFTKGGSESRPHLAEHPSWVPLLHSRTVFGPRRPAGQGSCFLQGCVHDAKACLPGQLELEPHMLLAPSAAAQAGVRLALGRSAQTSRAGSLG